MCLCLGIRDTAYASAHETKLENRNPSMGKVHVQNHAAPDKAPFFVLKPFKLMVFGAHGPVAILRAGIILETHNEETVCHWHFTPDSPAE